MVRHDFDFRDWPDVRGGGRPRHPGGTRRGPLPSWPPSRRWAGPARLTDGPICGAWARRSSRSCPARSSTTRRAAEMIALAATQPARRLGVVVPDVPGPLRDVVDCALMRERDARWQGAAAMSRALIEACGSSFGVEPANLPRLSAPQGVDAEGMCTNATERADALGEPGCLAPKGAALFFRRSP